MTPYVPSSHASERQLANERPRTPPARPARSREKPGPRSLRSLSATGGQLARAGHGSQDCAVVARRVARSAVPLHGAAVEAAGLLRRTGRRLFRPPCHLAIHRRAEPWLSRLIARSRRSPGPLHRAIRARASEHPVRFG